MAAAPVLPSCLRLARLVLSGLFVLLLAQCGGDSSSGVAGGASVGVATVSQGSALPRCADLRDPAPGSCLFETVGHFTSKEPYAPRQRPEAMEPVPEGFEVVAIQHVARHGSRALSSPDDDDLMLQLWTLAREEGALTPLGTLLGPVLEDIRRVHARVGYGQTSRLGEREHEETALRLLARHPGFFEEMARRGQRIEVFHSGRTRADESGEAFVRGLVQGLPDLEGLIEPGAPARETLYFNEAEGSEAFQRYRSGDPRMLAALRAIEEDPNTRAMARRMLLELFEDDFVDRLAAGAFVLRAEADPDDRIEDELDAAEALYGLYSIAVGMAEDADWDFGRFLHPEATAWFAYVDDAGSFYERGPGFADEEVTFAAATVLVDDLLARIDRALGPEPTHPVTLRFTHAQTMMPLAAWLGIEGASEGADPAVLFTYENNPWRSALVSPMAASIQWDVARNGEGVVLVRMLHNEGEVAFAPGCRAWREGSFFVELAELRRCYGR